MTPLHGDTSSIFRLKLIQFCFLWKIPMVNATPVNSRADRDCLAGVKIALVRSSPISKSEKVLKNAEFEQII